MMLFPATVSADSLITCGPGQIVDQLVGGDEYFLLAFGDGTTAATAGSLKLHIDEAVPPPEISVTINKSGTVDKQGIAHISGTVTCTSENDAGILFEVFGDVSQRVGRVVIRGFFDSFLDAPCDGSTIPWTADVVADNGAVCPRQGSHCRDRLRLHRLLQRGIRTSHDPAPERPVN
jgi:hypothetical protein